MRRELGHFSYPQFVVIMICDISILRAYFVIQVALFKLSDEISRIVFAIRRFMFLS